MGNASADVTSVRTTHWSTKRGTPDSRHNGIPERSDQRYWSDKIMIVALSIRINRTLSLTPPHCSYFTCSTFDTLSLSFRSPRLTYFTSVRCTNATLFFTPVYFTPICFNAHCQFTQLLNLRSLISGLTLNSWFTYTYFSPLFLMTI